MNGTYLTAPKPKLSWLMIVFGGFFLLAGILSFSTFSNSVTEPLRAISWTPHKAKVVSSSLDHRYDSDTGTTYRAVGVFEYVWKGQTFTSEKLDFSVGYDSQKAYHKGIVQQLESAKANKHYLRIFVNPDQPDEAVMLRRLRWEMVIFYFPFVTLFPLIGLAIILGTIWAYREARSEYAVSLHFPQEPWKWKRGWSNGVIRSDAKVDFWTKGLLALFWNLLAWPIAAVMTDTSWSGTPNSAWRYLIFIFPLIGIGLVFWAYKAFQQWQYFGATALMLETFPARQGETFKAAMSIVHTPPSETEFELTLQCVRFESDGDDTREIVLHESTKIQKASEGDLTVQPYQLPIEFELPSDLPDSDITNSTERIEWRLEVKAEAGKVGFKPNFELPVFNRP